MENNPSKHRYYAHLFLITDRREKSHSRRSVFWLNDYHRAFRCVFLCVLFFYNILCLGDACLLQRSGGERWCCRRKCRLQRRTWSFPVQEPATSVGQWLWRGRQLQWRRWMSGRRCRRYRKWLPQRRWRRAATRPLQQIATGRPISARRHPATGHAKAALLPRGWLGLGSGRRGRDRTPPYPWTPPRVRRVRSGAGEQVRTRHRGTRRYCIPLTYLPVIII